MTAKNDDTTAPKLGVIILGASEFPRFPPSRKLDNPSFARSAGAFHNMMIDPDSTRFGQPAVLDLFDSAEEPANIIRTIRSFLESLPTLADVVFYYCGHGDFLSDALRTYVLTLRATEPENEAFTALPPRQMKVALDSQLAMKRVYLVLDCCFAGRAASEWQSGGIGNVIEDQVFQVFPRRGTALVAASSRGAPALAPQGARLTMFTGALVETVSRGVQGEQRFLSFRDVFQSMKARIEHEYGRDAVLPEIHAPLQPEGDISFEPFFLNKGYAPPPEPSPTEAERELYKHACADLKSPLATTRAAALDVLAGLLVQTDSTPLRTVIARRIAYFRDNDDSNKVRDKCRRILQENAEGGLSNTSPSEIPYKKHAKTPVVISDPKGKDEEFFRAATKGQKAVKKSPPAAPDEGHAQSSSRKRDIEEIRKMLERSSGQATRRPLISNETSYFVKRQILVFLITSISFILTVTVAEKLRYVTNIKSVGWFVLASVVCDTILQLRFYKERLLRISTGSHVTTFVVIALSVLVFVLDALDK